MSELNPSEIYKAPSIAEEFDWEERMKEAGWFRDLLDDWHHPSYSRAIGKEEIKRFKDRGTVPSPF